jgi:UDP-GlcNAc:undecaprenyl-phosphate/decaprenyl-phosphate GlcNAc-1-phosphate transferase
MREYGLTILVAAAVTYLFTPLVRRFAVAVGAEHRGRARDVHTEPVPLLGGIAMYLGLAAALLVASRLTHLSTVFVGTRVGSGLLLAGGLVVLMGFVDDRWGLGAITKLAGQVGAGAILVWSGAVVAWLPVPGGGTLSLTSDQQTVLTILVVVVTINAVNFIDGLDGLAAGIVGIGAAAFFLYYYTLTKRLGLDEQTNPALASAILAGVCLGFLPHNFHPARIFMGDTGSMLLGLLLAYAPISSLASLDPNTLTNPAAYSGGTVNRFPEILPLLVPAIIMLIPYADLLLAVVRRTRAGQSPFSADKKHLQHRLLAIGHSHRASVLIMYLWAALFAGTVVLLSIMRTKLLVLAFVTLAGVLVLLLASMPRLRPWNRRGQLRLAPNVAGPAPSGGPGRAGAPVSSGLSASSAGGGSTARTGTVPGLASPASSAPPGSPMESRIPAAAGTSAQSRRRADRGASLDRGPGVDPGLGLDRGPGVDPGLGLDRGASLDRGPGVDPGAGGKPGPGSYPPGRGDGDAPYGAAGLGDAGHGNAAGSPEQSRPGPLWDANPAPAAWDGRRSGPARDADPSGPGWDADPSGPGWDASPSGPGWDADRARPSLDASPSGPGWDADPARPSLDADPSGPGWDADPAGPAWDADPSRPSWDASPAGPGWDADPSGPAWDLLPAEQSQPSEAAWDARSSAVAWDAGPAAREPEAGPSAEAWPVPDGLAAPSNGAPSDRTPSIGATSSGAPPSGPAERDESAEWYPGRNPGPPDTGRPDTGGSDTGRPATGRPDSGHPDSGLPDADGLTAGRPDSEPPDSAQWYPGRPDSEQRDSGWWDARPPDAGPGNGGPGNAGPYDGGSLADPRDASIYAAPPPEAAYRDVGPQDLDPLPAAPGRDQPGAPRAARPVTGDGDEYDEDSESPLLPWRLP